MNQFSNDHETSAYDRQYIGWKSWNDGRFGFFTEEEAEYFALELRPVLPAGKEARVLEIGFGNGGLLGWCLAEGLQYVGIEANPELLVRAERRGVRAFAALEDHAREFPDESFDCIIAMDVFEHIPSQRLVEVLRLCGRLLAGSGRIVARFPNGDSPFGRINQHGDMTHVTAIGRYQMLQLAGLADLQLIRIGPPANPAARSLKQGLKNLLSRIGSWCIERTCSRIYYPGVHIPFSLNYVAILRRRENAANP